MKLYAVYLAAEWKKMIALSILLLTGTLIQLANPQLLKLFINHSMHESGYQSILIPLMFILLSIATHLFSLGASYLGLFIGLKATNALKVDLLRHSLSLKMSFYDRNLPGSMIERIDGDVNPLVHFFSQIVVSITTNFLVWTGIIILLFLEGWQIGITMLLFSAVAFYIIIRTRKLIIPYWSKLRELTTEYYGLLQERISALDEIRVNGAANYTIRLMSKLFDRWLILQRKAITWGSIPWVVSVMLYQMAMASAFIICYYLSRHGAISLGSIYVVFYYSGLLIKPLEDIRIEMDNLQQAEANIKRVNELFSIEPEEQKSSISWKSLLHYSIRYEDVSFSYSTSGNLLLQNINIHVKHGETLCILGRTGSGKSTLARLLTGLYKPKSGRIVIGDVQVEEITTHELRDGIGYVTQEVQLFHGTIRDNLTLFNPSIEDFQIIQAFDELGLTEWYRERDKGLDSLIGPTNSKLSSGEAQLLTVVRVFLKDPKIIILDEATSQLDISTELKLKHAIQRLLQGRTGIIITHRIELTDLADCIMILDQGNVSESGSMQELSNQTNSQYRQLLARGIEGGQP